MPLTIRLAAPGDARQAKACIDAAFEAYIPLIGKPPAPMCLDLAAEIAARHVWLAENDGAAAGVLVQYETDTGFYLDTVAVLPQLHGTGVGRALLQHAERTAVECGCDSIWLVTNAVMARNQVLYPRIGYVEFDRRHDGGYQRVFYRKTLRAQGSPVLD
jgi:ribosomal protein S18 acetylase RimI-like enzyme